jgi:hypothetical protein
MRSNLCALAAVLCIIVAQLSYAQPAGIPTPSEHLGFTVGADRTLADYRQISSYFKKLADLSPRVDLEILGPTTLGNEMVMAVISSEQNLRDKEKYRTIARALADPRGRTPQEIASMVSEGKVILLVTCSIHASEIGASQMAMEWAHALATARDPETLRRLENVILLLVPSLNPDGNILEVEWYRKWLGTPYEGGRLPWLYHHYTGHDDNRDWFMLTQKETRAMNRAAYHEWFPQVWLDEHQMGATGPRLFVPPYNNPVAPNVHPLIWRSVDVIGTTMSLRLEQAGKSGVAYGYLFDAYWPGGTKNTAWWKNVVGLLTEMASVRVATPIDVSPTELSGGAKGLAEYQPQVNFPNPWPGGTWRLRDIMDYERIASDALLEACASHREDFLRNIAVMALNGVALGDTAVYWQIPLEQRDPATAARLAHILRDNGADVRFSPRTGAFYLPTAQPYARFVNEFLGTQKYPEVKPTPGAPILEPYDMTAWSLPLMMDVTVSKVRLSPTQAGELRPALESDGLAPEAPAGTAYLAVPRSSNNAARAINLFAERKIAVRIADAAFMADGPSMDPGAIVVENSAATRELLKILGVRAYGLGTLPPATSLRIPRTGMYKPYMASMDEGWTRWILEEYHFPLKNIENKGMKAGKFDKDYEVIILPDIGREVIVDGKRKRNEGEMKYVVDLPPDYTGGIGKEGVKNLKEFVEQGGMLITLGSSADLVIEEFNVPVSNALAKAGDAFECPGSILHLQVDPSHPVGYGMPPSVPAFVNEPIAFQTAIPGAEMTRRVLAWYPDDTDGMVLSGWIKGAERLKRKAAAVALTYGKGKIVMFGFRVQHRAQTEGTFKLLFNAIYWGAK